MRLCILALAVLGLTASGSPLPGEIDKIVPQVLANSGSNLGNVLNVNELKSIPQPLRHTKQPEQRKYIPEFFVEFDVDQSTGETYRKLIERMRRRVQDPEVRSHGRPVLPPQQSPPSRWFEMVLRTRSQALRLRIRSDNLYLDGYRAENSDQWFEFNHGSSNLQLINDSRPLGFSGSYTHLQNAADLRRDQIYLGQQQLTRAVNQLATTANSVERARSLLVIIQMISESIRLTHISDTIANSYTTGFIPDGQIIALENGWGDISGALLHHDQNPEGPIRLPRPNDMNINSVTMAAALIGILLRYNINSSSKPRRQVQTLIPEGRPLVEILWVSIDNIDEEDPGDLYGTITATDGLGSQHVYNIDRDNYQSISPHQHVALSGLSRAISAAGSFNIDLNLKDKDGDASPDDEVSRGQISWNVYDPSNTYDVSHQKPIGGEYGQATVNYVVMSNAAEAVVEVVLINGDNEIPADVYGKISVRSKFVQREIFHKADNEYIDVSPGQPIPLSRAVMAVPMDDTLEIHADLWDHDSDLSPNDEIAKGFAKFRPQILRSTKERIRGRYGEVEVRITWS